MKRPTALLIPSPWSGDEADPIPRTYRAWSWLYVKTRRLRHRFDRHDWESSPIGGNWRRCSWCGRPDRPVRSSPEETPDAQ